MNSTYECVNFKQYAGLLTLYEALKREQARIQSNSGGCASEVNEIVAQVAGIPQGLHAALGDGPRSPDTFLNIPDQDPTISLI